MNIDKFKFIAHRGLFDREKIPENSMLAFDKALEKAFDKTRTPKKDFTVTKWGKDKYGKSHPVEWRASNGAEVSVDIGHSVQSGAPTADHVGWQTGGKRSSGGGVRGHIFVDEVPYNR